MKRASLIVLAAAAALLPATRASAIDQDILDLIARFDGIRNDSTPIGVTDGNPLAATSFLATSRFNHYGLQPRISDAPRTAENDWTIDLQTRVGGFESGSLDGVFGTLELEFGYRFSDSVALSLLLPFEYREIGNTDTYVGGIELGFPLTILPNRRDGFAWTVTPTLTVAGAGVSASLAQGGYLFGGGLTSSLAWRRDAITLVMANQVSYDWGRPIGYSEDFDLRQDIEQVILKNGVEAIWTINQSFAADAGVSYTNLLDDAFVNDYWTFSAGVTYAFNPSSGVRVSFDSDYADNFKTYGGGLQFYVSF